MEKSPQAATQINIVFVDYQRFFCDDGNVYPMVPSSQTLMELAIDWKGDIEFSYVVGGIPKAATLYLFIDDIVHFFGCDHRDVAVRRFEEIAAFPISYQGSYSYGPQCQFKSGISQF